MSNIDKIKLSKENLQKEIMKEMMNLVDKFKEYVSVDHTKYPKYQIIEGICTKINYGIIKNDYPELPLKLFENRENNNYYCFLPEKIEFLNKYSSTRKWYSNLIFYNEKLNCWFVYNNDKMGSWSGYEEDCLKKIDEDKVDEFTSLDIETQIAFLEQLEKLLN
jgi:hypothetical protein